MAQKRQLSVVAACADSSKRCKGSESDARPAIEVDFAFAGNSDLLDWVTSSPDGSTLCNFHEWAEKLRGIITDHEPEERGRKPTQPWTSTEDAISLLRTIQR